MSWIYQHYKHVNHWPVVGGRGVVDGDVVTSAKKHNTIVHESFNEYKVKQTVGKLAYN